ncbi:hypothetical protein O6H91_Y217200 [Diphasiastrum complanatum]|nr:hypothetical protein O6H91_Y217200 [Diphasiastrum complanatum]
MSFAGVLCLFSAFHHGLIFLYVECLFCTSPLAQQIYTMPFCSRTILRTTFDHPGLCEYDLLGFTTPFMVFKIVIFNHSKHDNSL